MPASRSRVTDALRTPPPPADSAPGGDVPKNVLKAAADGRVGPNGHVQIVELLLKRGAHVNLQSSRGITALNTAAYYGSERMVDLLLLRGAELNPQDAWPALAAAAKGGKERVVDLLLRRGAEIDVQDSDGCTALILATRFNRPIVVHRLLRAGADMTLRDVEGKTALQIAKERGHAEYVEAFRTHIGEVAAVRSKAPSAEAGGAGAAAGASAAASASSGEGGAGAALSSGGAVPEEVVQAARRGDEAVLAWLDGGGRVNATFEYVFSDGERVSGMTLLMLAMTRGHEGLAETLLQREADLELQSSDGDTALSLAAANGFEKLIELALRHGAKINQQTALGGTALMDAAGDGHEKAVDSLIRHGAAIDQQSNTGDTALIRAAFYGHPAALLRLLRAGADMTLRTTRDGFSALQWAKHKGHAECVRALAEHAAAERAAMTIALTPAAATSIVQAATSGQHIAHERARGGGGALACSMSSGASGPPCSSSRFE